MKTHMSFQEYSSVRAVNWSCLKEMSRSPLHYAHRLTRPRDDTPAMRFGRACHTAVLEPDRFPLEYVVFDGARRAGKEWDAFAAVNSARTILKADEYQTALALRDAVHAHPVAGQLLASGLPELSLQWTDAATGLPCKARIDWWDDSTLALTDLKTTKDVQARVFGHLAARLGYHGQVAFYRAGVKAVYGCEATVRIVAAEAEAPHDVAVFGIDDDCLYAGEEEVKRLLQLVAECRESGVWPGRYPEEVPLELPTWVFPDDETSGLMVAGGY